MLESIGLALPLEAAPLFIELIGNSDRGPRKIANT